MADSTSKLSNEPGKKSIREMQEERDKKAAERWKNGGKPGAKPLEETKRKKIIADYVMTNSFAETARMNDVNVSTVRKYVSLDKELTAKLQAYHETQQTDIYDYMRGLSTALCDLISLGMSLLPQKLVEAKTSTEIATTLGILIDKWSMIPQAQSNKQVESMNKLLDAITSASETAITVIDTNGEVEKPEPIDVVVADEVN